MGQYRSNASEVFEINTLLKNNKKLLEDADKLNRNGVSLLTDLGSFLFKDQIQGLIYYESFLPYEFDSRLRNICLYHQKDFDKMSINQKDIIISSDKIAIKV